MARIAAPIDEPEDDRNKPPARHKGWLTAYIHTGDKLGVLLELSCKSEFLARSEEFSWLMNDVVIHIAAVNPKYISRKDVPREASAKQEEIFRQEMADSDEVARKMAEFYQEVCLLEQPFVKEPGITVGQLIATRSDEWGDEITVQRFVRFRVGEAETVAGSKVQGR
jgi:elongation factor Ts